MAEEENKKKTTKKKPVKKVVRKEKTVPTKTVTKKSTIKKAAPKKTDTIKEIEKVLKKELPKIIEPEKEKKVEEKKVEEPKKEKKEKKKSFALTKREKLLIGLVILTIIVTGVMYYLMFGAKYYNFKANWGLHIPKSVEEVYSVKGKKDEFGDYNTYYILKYEKEEDVAKLVSWSKSDVETIQYKSTKEAVNEWLNVLGIENNNRPTFENVEYWYKNDAKSDEIIMIKDKTNKRIYVLEFFLKDE